MLRFKMLYILHQDVSTGFERAPVSARALPRNAGWGGETPGCSVRCPRFPSRAKQMKEAAEGFLHHSKGATGKACDLKWLAGHPETNQTCSPVGDRVSLTYLEPVWRRGKKNIIIK